MTAVLDQFRALGAQDFTTDILQPAGALLDLYGEDIRARALVTHDAQRGELMLRPDFTVPLVLHHGGAGAARYCYSGRIFRQQDGDRPTEYTQTGYEVFGGPSADADAEVFCAMAQAVGPLATPEMGDMGVLLAAVDALSTTPLRKAALARHIWRPARFRALLDRYGAAQVAPSRAALLAQADPMAGVSDVLGLRSRAEIQARIDRLRADADQPPIPAAEVALVEALLAAKGTAPQVLLTVRTVAADLPALMPAADRLRTRLDRLSQAGVDVANLRFDLTLGRAGMEYYDGMIFAFRHGDGPPVALGGRYDALTRALGVDATAVGGVIRPDLMEAAR